MANTTNPKSASIIVLLGVIILLTGGVSFLLYDNFKKDEILSSTSSYIENVEDNNDSISIALEQEIKQLQLLNIKYQELHEENNEIKSLITELVREKESWRERSKLNHKQILSLKSELEQTISDYDRQRIILLAKVDSLIEINVSLQTDNNKLRNSNDSLEDLSLRQLHITEGLLMKVSQLKAENLNIVVKTRLGKEVLQSPYKNRNVGTISSVFNLSKNQLASKGNKTIVVRIEKPDGGILYDVSGNGNTFTTASNLKYYYTVSRQVYFKNEYEQISLTYNKQEELTSGTYAVNIFLDGVNIGATNFDIK